MSDKLIDINIDEISLVDFAANRKKFLIIKNMNTRTPFAMQDGSGIIGERNKVMKELRKLFKDYFGDEFEKEEFEKFEKAELKSDILNAIKGALKLVVKYKGDFPDDLKKAVGVLAKYASYGYGTTEKRGDDFEKALKDALEKSGAKLSKSTIEQITKTIEILSKLIGLEIKKKTDVELIQEQIDSLKKSIEDAVKKKDEDEVGTETEKLTETIDALKKRLETVEKSKGVKKSFDEDGKEIIDKNDSQWPSFDLE